MGLGTCIFASPTAPVVRFSCFFRGEWRVVHGSIASRTSHRVTVPDSSVLRVTLQGQALASGQAPVSILRAAPADSAIFCSDSLGKGLFSALFSDTLPHGWLSAVHGASWQLRELSLPGTAFSQGWLETKAGYSSFFAQRGVGNCTRCVPRGVPQRGWLQGSQ